MRPAVSGGPVLRCRNADETLQRKKKKEKKRKKKCFAKKIIKSSQTPPTHTHTHTHTHTQTLSPNPPIPSGRSRRVPSGAPRNPGFVL